MKKYYFILITLFLFSITTSAQFVDDMEYPNGPPYGDWWVSAPIIGGGVGLIPGDGMTDAVLDLGNKIFGEWWLSFWQYIPSNKEAYWNLQGTVPVGGGEWIVGNIFFNHDLANPGVGLIDDTALGAVNFNFPHDQWFEIEMNWDISLGISAATWEMYVGGIEVIPLGTPFTNNAGTIPTSLGGIDFFSISTDNELYLDDFYYSEPIIVGINDFSKKDFKIFPNPAEDIVFIESQSTIEMVRIYSVLGNLVKEVSNKKRIEISHLKAGMYLIEVTSASGKSVQKFIKE